MRIALAGDVMLGRNVDEELDTRSPDYVWGDTWELFRSADLRICNLECVISDIGELYENPPKLFHFRSKAKNVAVLSAAGIDGVSVANNHALDYGPEAMKDGLRLLDDARIGHAGAGATKTEAMRPATLEAGDISVALIAFTDNVPEWEAQEEGPGVFFVPIPDGHREADLLKAISEARLRHDLVIVAAHWGSNWGSKPEPGHAGLARRMIAAGAGIIAGHSCHITRGVEVVDGAPILYGLGDFIDDYAVHPIECNDRTLICLVDLEGNRVAGLRLHPALIEECRVTLARDPVRAEIADRTMRLCKELGTACEWDAKGGFVSVRIRR